MDSYPKYRADLTRAANKFNQDMRNIIEPVIMPMLNFITKMLNKIVKP